MTPAPISSFSLATALMWAVFIGCLGALLAYDTIRWVLRFLISLARRLDHD